MNRGFRESIRFKLDKLLVLNFLVLILMFFNKFFFFRVEEIESDLDLLREIYLMLSLISIYLLVSMASLYEYNIDLDKLLNSLPLGYGENILTNYIVIGLSSIFYLALFAPLVYVMSLDQVFFTLGYIMLFISLVFYIQYRRGKKSRYFWFIFWIFIYFDKYIIGFIYKNMGPIGDLLSYLIASWNKLIQYRFIGFIFLILGFLALVGSYKKVLDIYKNTDII